MNTSSSRVTPSHTIASFLMTTRLPTRAPLSMKQCSPMLQLSPRTAPCITCAHAHTRHPSPMESLSTSAIGWMSVVFGSSVIIAIIGFLGPPVAASREQPVKVFACPLRHRVRHQFIGEPLGKSRHETAQFRFGRRWQTAGPTAKNRYGFLFATELAFVTQQSFLIRITEAEVERREAVQLGVSNRLPDQEIVRAMRQIIVRRCVELVVESRLPLEEQVAGDYSIVVNGEEKESLSRLQELSPDVPEE